MNKLRLVLIPFSALYWLATVARNWLFDTGVLRVNTLSVPVVSIGNISAGGTGKTPMVEIIVKKMRARGKRPAVVSRGYGRNTSGLFIVSDGGLKIATARNAGDEPVLLATRLPGTPVVVDEDRREAAETAIREMSSDSIVLDDGFQHRFVKRNLDIVLLTAQEMQARQWLLPAGNRRETEGSLRRADVVVITKCKDHADFHNAAKNLDHRLMDRLSGLQLIPCALRRVSTGQLLDKDAALGSPVTTFAGIANPDSLKDSVEQFGCKVMGHIALPDHHWYTETDLARLRREYERHNAQLIITTEKDLVRLRAMGRVAEEFISNLPLHVLEVKLDFIVGEEIIDRCIDKAVT